jgi:exosortase/archaeosortase family protein
VGFLVRFILAWLLGLLALAAFPQIEGLAITATLKSISATTLPLDIPCRIVGSSLEIAGANLEIITDCTPIMATLMLWSAMIAFPARGHWRALGMLAGLIVLWLYNIARVLVLAFVLGRQPRWFNFVHIYLWQTLTLGVVGVIFALWAARERRRLA